MTRDLITPVLRNDFREFCVNNLVLRQINDIFTMAGIKRGSLPSDRPLSGQRRILVEEYYALLNWHTETDVDTFLQVIGYALAQSYPSDEPRTILRAFCEREGLAVDGIHIYRKTNKPPIDQPVAIDAVRIAALKNQLIDLNTLSPQPRGFAFEIFLKDLFAAYGLAPRASFRLVGEQIDGSFQLHADIYLLEAKWQSHPTAQDDLLIFRGKVEGKSTWTRGLFISVNGFSEDGLTAFSRGRATNMIGMSGQDLYFVLSGEISLGEAIEKKIRRAAETGAFFVPVFDLLRS